MSLRSLLAAVLLAGGLIVSQAQAQQARPLVDLAWLKAQAGKQGVVVLDASGNAAAFAQGHIPGAVFTDFAAKDGWRVDRQVGDKKAIGQLPEIAHLEKLIGSMGIGNQDHVVVVSAGRSAGDVSVAARIYWTFKLLGHDRVSILDGGMVGYLKDKANPLEKGMGAAPAAKAFKANYRPEMRASADEVKGALGGGTALLDFRPQDQFVGINKASSVQRHGTLPGAVNVPGEWATRDGGGELRSIEGLKSLYALQQAPAEGNAIAFCNTGIWASLGWFVNSELLGNKQTKMYDGSMSDWTIDAAAPMVRKVKLD
ncbi:MAG: sulfurtransferase [Alphaproteobacteria bacterium]|nr:sulfurtransferase [Alphaproteobacteria bacterium]